MNSIELLKNLSFNLSSVAYSKVGKEWNYKDVISTFSRLYLVTEGSAIIYMGKERIQLKKGYLYLVPSFTHCSYVCEGEMEHYYATFSMSLPNNYSIYQLFNFSVELKATEEHISYFKKLSSLNPYMALPAKNPKVYQKIKSSQWNVSVKDAQRSIISSGLLHLLLSKFIKSTKIEFDKGDSISILETLKYIHGNLDTDLTVLELSKKACLSRGYYSKRFKKITNQTPLAYIHSKRIENAQLLLLTTTQSCIEIAEVCGFKSNAYFSKIFKKYCGLTPGEFRRNGAT